METAQMTPAAPPLPEGFSKWREAVKELLSRYGLNDTLSFWSHLNWEDMFRKDRAHLGITESGVVTEVLAEAFGGKPAEEWPDAWKQRLLEQYALLGPRYKWKVGWDALTPEVQAEVSRELEAMKFESNFIDFCKLQLLLIHLEASINLTGFSMENDFNGEAYAGYIIKCIYENEPFFDQMMDHVKQRFDEPPLHPPAPPSHAVPRQSASALAESLAGTSPVLTFPNKIDIEPRYSPDHVYTYDEWIADLEPHIPQQMISLWKQFPLKELYEQELVHNRARFAHYSWRTPEEKEVYELEETLRQVLLRDSNVRFEKLETMAEFNIEKFMELKFQEFKKEYEMPSVGDPLPMFFLQYLMKSNITAVSDSIPDCTYGKYLILQLRKTPVIQRTCTNLRKRNYRAKTTGQLNKDGDYVIEKSCVDPGSVLPLVNVEGSTRYPANFSEWVSKVFDFLQPKHYSVWMCLPWKELYKHESKHYENRKRAATEDGASLQALAPAARSVMLLLSNKLKGRDESMQSFDIDSFRAKQLKVFKAMFDIPAHRDALLRPFYFYYMMTSDVTAHGRCDGMFELEDKSYAEFLLESLFNSETILKGCTNRKKPTMKKRGRPKKSGEFYGGDGNMDISDQDDNGFEDSSQPGPVKAEDAAPSNPMGDSSGAMDVDDDRAKEKSSRSKDKERATSPKKSKKRKSKSDPERDRKKRQKSHSIEVEENEADPILKLMKKHHSRLENMIIEKTDSVMKAVESLKAALDLPVASTVEIPKAAEDAIDLITTATTEIASKIEHAEAHVASIVETAMSQVPVSQSALNEVVMQEATPSPSAEKE